MSINLDNIKQGTNSKHNEGPSFAGKFNELLKKDFTLFSPKLNDKKKDNFYSSLNTLFSSGIDIKTALEIIVEENTKVKDREIFENLKNDVINGDSLSQAMIKSGYFSAYEFQSIVIGEESGRLPVVLNELSKYYTNKIKQRRQITGALTYPLLVLGTALVAVIFMMNFIVPMFTDVFKRFGGELPALTKYIIRLSDFISGNMGIFFLIIISLIAFGIYSKTKLWYRRFSSYIMLHMPFFGSLINKIYQARFSQAMALLLGAKTPILKSLQLVKQMIGFYPYEIALEKIEDMVMHGKAFHQGMQQFSVFDKRMVSLTKVAEEVNKLDTMFETLYNQYTNEIEHQASVMTGILEPLLIIVVGVIVAVILISMYLPLFQISSSIF